MHLFSFKLIFLLCLSSDSIICADEHEDEGSALLIDDAEAETEVAEKKLEDPATCQLNVDHNTLFSKLHDLELKYTSAIAAFEEAVDAKKMDEIMLKSLLNSRGMSDQAIQDNLGRLDLIPAGLDLGSYCILRMQESILFFQRMKLRNSTKFKVQYVKNDLKSLVVRVKLSLNDLHLHGTYERLMESDTQPTNLYYAPTYGKADIMLKDVEFKLEGRYRMLKDRFIIDVVVSALRLTEAVIVTEAGNSGNKSTPSRLVYNELEDLLMRMKLDLDVWIKDCFNDRLMNYDFANATVTKNYLEYHHEKNAVDNNYIHYLVGVLYDRISQLNLEAIALPDFTIYSVDKTIFRMRNGVLRGLDTLYKKSIGTSYLGSPNGTLRHVCAEVGFGNIQVTYTYELLEVFDSLDNPKYVPTAITGLLVLTSKELRAILAAGVMINPNSMELSFQGLKQLGPESLTIEGPANKLLGRYQHIIQNHVMALMSFSISYHVRNLKTLTDCEPDVIPYHEAARLKIKESKLSVEHKDMEPDKKIEPEVNASSSEAADQKSIDQEKNNVTSMPISNSNVTSNKQLRKRFRMRVQ